jgi:hypothetical protein
VPNAPEPVDTDGDGVPDDEDPAPDDATIPDPNAAGAPAVPGNGQGNGQGNNGG